MAVGKRTRFEVFKRDRFQCQYCGRKPPQVVLEADHISPASGGGPDIVENLVTSCMDCNRGKSDIPLTDLPRPLADTIQEATEKREQLAAYGAFLEEVRATEDESVSQLSIYWLDKLLPAKKHGMYVFTYQQRKTTLLTFVRRLPLVLIKESMDIAEARIEAKLNDDLSRWKYFCGVCWNKVRDAEGQQ